MPPTKKKSINQSFFKTVLPNNGITRDLGFFFKHFCLGFLDDNLAYMTRPMLIKIDLTDSVYSCLSVSIKFDNLSVCIEVCSSWQAALS